MNLAAVYARAPAEELADMGRTAMHDQVSAQV